MGARADDAARAIERARAIGLFRYQLIREAADPAHSTRARGRLVRAVAAASTLDPTGRRVRVSRDTLDRWIRAWRRGGFDALVPSPRQSAPAVAGRGGRDGGRAQAGEPGPDRRAGRGGSWAPRWGGRRASGPCNAGSPTTRSSPTRLAAGASGPVFGRFEAVRPNELWTGDALHGPHVGGRKTYLFAFLDDHSRAIVGHRFGFAEDTVRLAAALRPALGSRGVPDGIYVDNGSAFVDAWLLRACAKLGIRLIHSTPGRPQGRGKIERYLPHRPRAVPGRDHREPRGRSQPAPGRRPGRAQPAVHRLGRDRSTTARSTPRPERPRSPAGAPAARSRCPSTDALAEAFLWEEQRTVTKTALVSLQGNTYQVDPLLVGRRVELVFDPFDLTRIAGPAAAASRPGPRSRTGSGATPTSRPDPRPHPSCRRRPGSTTPASSPTIHHAQLGAPGTGVNYAALAGSTARRQQRSAVPDSSTCSPTTRPPTARLTDGEVVS